MWRGVHGVRRKIASAEMSSLKEQRCSWNSVWNSGNPSWKLLSWLPRLMVRMLWNVPCSMSGLPGSKRDDNQRKMMSIPEDHQCWLTTPYIEKVNDLVRANQRLTVREFAEECGISIGSCYETLTENWGCIESPPNLCFAWWQQTRNNNRIQVC